MDDISTGTLALALFTLLVASGFFSLAETAMMAVNRFRLKHRAQRGALGAKSALALLAETDRLLGVVLLGNNLINAASATLTTVITVRLFGEGEVALALGTVFVTFGILVISEITPKVIGAAHADAIAPAVSFVLRPMLRVATPIVWFVNLFVQGLLRILLIRPTAEVGPTLTQEELRSLVLEGQYFRGKHRAMLANLLDLESITVDDVMTPRNQIHAIDITSEQQRLVQQLAASYHTRLPVYENELDNIIGTLHLKQVLHLQHGGNLDREAITSGLRPAYFVPSGTPLFQQLQLFQDNKQRLGLVVDEYGEVQGLVTLEDIIEEIVAEIASNAPALRSRRLRCHCFSLFSQPDARPPALLFYVIGPLGAKMVRSRGLVQSAAVRVPFDPKAAWPGGLISSRRPWEIDAFATSSYDLNVARPRAAMTLVMAAVSVVLPWSM